MKSSPFPKFSESGAIPQGSLQACQPTETAPQFPLSQLDLAPEFALSEQEAEARQVLQRYLSLKGRWTTCRRAFDLAGARPRARTPEPDAHQTEHRPVSPTTLRVRRHRLASPGLCAPHHRRSAGTFHRGRRQPRPAQTEDRTEAWPVIQARYAAQLSHTAMDSLITGRVIAREQRGAATAISSASANGSKRPAGDDSAARLDHHSSLNRPRRCLKQVVRIALCASARARSRS